jgi:hypothetical protein
MFELTVIDNYGSKHEYTFDNEHAARRMAYEWKHKTGADIELTKNGEVIYEHDSTRSC